MTYKDKESIRGQISISFSGEVYLCHNAEIACGAFAQDRMGYQYSYCLGFDPVVYLAEHSYVIKNFVLEPLDRPVTSTAYSDITFPTIKPTTPMSLITQFKQLFTTEPQKTFIKLGITTESGTLTDEGVALLIQHLFHKEQETFYTEVAKPLFDEQEKERKKK